MASSFLPHLKPNQNNKKCHTPLSSRTYFLKVVLKTYVASIQRYGMIEEAKVGYECTSIPGYFHMLSVSEQISGITI